MGCEGALIRLGGTEVWMGLFVDVSVFPEMSQSGRSLRQLAGVPTFCRSH